MRQVSVRCRRSRSSERRCKRSFERVQRLAEEQPESRRIVEMIRDAGKEAGSSDGG